MSLILKHLCILDLKIDSTKIIIEIGMNDKVFNDTVHGHMTFEPILVKIMDTCEFQRLRNIKQLGVAYYVYPSASHNRFEHCLGTCHMARQFLDALKRTQMDESFYPTPQETICVLISALCHDVGHGPFSHTWEKFINKATHGESKWKHEETSTEILEKILKQDQVKVLMHDLKLKEEHVEFMKSLIDVPKNVNRHKKYYLYQIVSNKENDIDVDKWDYILRDQKQLNIQNNFDPHRLMNFCQVLRVKRSGCGDRPEICIRDKEMQNVADMLQARAVLHHKAYQHPVVQIIETMIVDALLLANEARPDWELTNTSVEHLLTLTDSLYQNILYSKDERLAEARELLKRVETRKLYKLLYTHECKDKDDLSQLWTNLKCFLSNNNNDELQSVIADLEILEIKVNMGGKYREDGINCFQFTKNSKVPELHKKNNFLLKPIMCDEKAGVLKRQLLTIYKGVKPPQDLADEIRRFFETSQTGSGIKKEPNVSSRKRPKNITVDLDSD